ncbi:MAG: hypothetical protein IJE24_02370 [Oscillospiraceae bacterium]|nr:hypothetical protein [Oscillospiraceae bacterium]
MTAPALAADRFLAACLIGMQLGFVYDFLRPLRPKFTAVGDILFLFALGAGWVYLGFGVCRGDLRFGYTVGLLAGILFWELTATRLLRRFFAAFWRPFQKFFRIFIKNVKKLFATAQKKVTIKCTQKIQKRRQRHEKADKTAQPHSHKIRPQQPPHQDRGDRYDRRVYGIASDAESDHQRYQQKDGRRPKRSRPPGVRKQPAAGRY